MREGEGGREAAVVVGGGEEKRRGDGAGTEPATADEGRGAQVEEPRRGSHHDTLAKRIAEAVCRVYATLAYMILKNFYSNSFLIICRI